MQAPKATQTAGYPSAKPNSKDEIPDSRLEQGVLGTPLVKNTFRQTYAALLRRRRLRNVTAIMSVTSLLPHLCEMRHLSRRTVQLQVRDSPDPTEILPSLSILLSAISPLSRRGGWLPDPHNGKRKRFSTEASTSIHIKTYRSKFFQAGCCSLPPKKTPKATLTTPSAHHCPHPVEPYVKLIDTLSQTLPNSVSPALSTRECAETQPLRDLSVSRGFIIFTGQQIPLVRRSGLTLTAVFQRRGRSVRFTRRDLAHNMQTKAVRRRLLCRASMVSRVASGSVVALLAR